MGPFLPPVEEPKSLLVKLAYAMTRRQFGKVLTPVKVVYSRIPLAFGVFIGKIPKLDKKLELPLESQFLVREQVARINVCEFCIDIGRAFVIQAKLNEAKFDALEQYRTSALFSDAERSLLDYVFRADQGQKREDGILRASRQTLFRTPDLRDRVARRYRAFV